MEKVQHFLLLLCFCLPLSLWAQGSVVGDWESEVPTEDGSMTALHVSIKADGTYTVDLGGDGSIDIKGKYTFEDGQMTIEDTGGPDSCPGKGVYKVEASADTLTMTRVSDECEGRGGPEGVMQMNKA